MQMKYNEVVSFISFSRHEIKSTQGLKINLLDANL